LLALKLKIREEYLRLLPPLPPAEYEALKESIRVNGLLNPIVVNPKGVILDGVHRYRACMELGIEPKYVIKKFNDPLEEKRFIIESNLMRRQLTKFQRIEAALPLIEIERELAKKRKLSTLKKGDELPDPQKFGERGEALELVAKKIGVSHETIRQALWLIENAPKEELDKLCRGEKSISRLYMELKSRMERPTENHMPSYVAKLLKPPKVNYTLKISKYRNSNLVVLMLERSIYEEFERNCRLLGAKPEHILTKAIEEYRRKIKRAINHKKNNARN